MSAAYFNSNKSRYSAHIKFTNSQINAEIDFNIQIRFSETIV